MPSPHALTLIKSLLLFVPYIIFIILINRYLIEKFFWFSTTITILATLLTFYIFFTNYRWFIISH